MLLLFLIHSTKVRILSDMTKNIVLIFLKIFYEIYSGIIPDFFSNNLMEIITRIDPVFLAGNCWTCDGFLGCFNLIEVKNWI